MAPRAAMMEVMSMVPRMSMISEGMPNEIVGRDRCGVGGAMFQAKF